MRSQPASQGKSHNTLLASPSTTIHSTLDVFDSQPTSSASHRFDLLKAIWTGVGTGVGTGVLSSQRQLRPTDRPTDEQMMIPKRMANVLRGKSDILKYTCPVPTRACSWDGKSKLVNTHTHLCTKSNWHVVSCSLIFRARVRN